MQLPVTTEVALHGGLDFFHYPKFMSNIEFKDVDNKQICEVKDFDTNEMLFKFSGNKIKTKKSKKLNTALYNSYPEMNNTIIQADLLVNQIEKGTKWLGNDFSFEIGNHSQSQILKDLKLSRLMQYVYMPSGQAILFEPKEMNV